MHDEGHQEDQAQFQIAAAVDQHLPAHVDGVLDEPVSNPEVLLHVLVDLGRAVQVEVGEVLRLANPNPT